MQTIGYNDDITGKIDLHDMGVDLADRMFWDHIPPQCRLDMQGQAACKLDPAYPDYCMVPLIYDEPLPLGIIQNRPDLKLPELFSHIKLAKGAGGKLYVISDSDYYIWFVGIKETAYKYINLLVNPTLVSVRHLLANAKEAYDKYHLIAGEKLSPAQVHELEKPILWPTWRKACVGDEKCISFTLYIPAKILDDPLARASTIIGGRLDNMASYCARSSGDNEPCNDGVDVRTGGVYVAGDLNYDNTNKPFHLDTETVVEGSTDIQAKEVKMGVNSKLINKENIKLRSANNLIIEGAILQALNGWIFTKAEGQTKITPAVNSAGNIQAPVFISQFNLTIDSAQGIYDEASHKFVNGSYTAISQGDIVERTLHTTRVYEIYQYAGVFHLAHAIDEHPHLSYIAGDANYKAKNYIGKGTFKHVGGKIQLEIEGNVDISAITTRAVNIHSEEDCGFFSCSERTDVASVTETTVPESHAKQIEITAGGTCNIEGAQMKGDKIIIKCREGISFNGHKVENFYHMTISESGFLGADVPAFDAFASDNPGKVVRDKIGFLNALNQAAHMHGPLDLAGVMSAVSQGYRLYKDIAYLQSAQGGGYGLGGAIIMSIVNQLASATVSFGSRETEYHGRSVYTIGSKLFGDIIELWSEGDIDATQVDIEGTESVKVSAKNLKLKSGQNTRNTEFSSESASFDFTISPLAAGAGFSYSTQEGSSQSVKQNPSSIKAPKIEITVDEKLEIVSSFIDGEEVDITATEVEIRDLLDTEYSEMSASGFSLGVSVNFAGGVTPYGSINTFDEVKSSGFINFLSRITGQSVHITAQKLIHNAAHIKGENVTLDVENIEYVELPAAYREFESFGMNMGASAGLDGTFNPSFGFRWSDGDTVISAYIDSALIEAAQKLKKWLDNPTFDFPTIQEKEPPKTNVEEDTSNEQENAESKKPNLETKKQTKDEHAEEKEHIEAEQYFEFAKDRYGKENFENASHKVQKAYNKGEALDTFENVPFEVEDGGKIKLILTDDTHGLTPAGAGVSTKGIVVVAEIVAENTPRALKLLLKGGIFVFVRLQPALLAASIGYECYKHSDVIYDFIGGKSFTQDTKLYEQKKASANNIKDGTKSKDTPFVSTAAGGSPEPNDQEPDDSNHHKKDSNAQHHESNRRIEFLENDANIKHIFRDAEGHVPDTPSNRKLILDTVNNENNFIATDKWGNKWYAKSMENGKQIWGRVRGNQVINAGINNIEKDIIREYGQYFR